jgi:threonylcarbamoyladenosine tRNA methylthiotransferase MtaB
MTTVAIATLGCKVNQFESESLMDSLEQRGYSLVPPGEKADIVIINTCTVTHRADFQSRQMIRRAVRSNPGSLVIVTGCYSQVAPDATERMEGVAYLLGNSEKVKIPDLLPLMQQGRQPRVQVGDILKERVFRDVPLHSFHRHTRAFLKIQDGCNACCSYCIVPYARGPSRSLPPEKVLENLMRLKEKGFKEVVLTGIHIGGYGLDLSPASSLKTLLKGIEQEDSPSRIRLSSIEPLDFSAGLIELLSGSSKVCPHLHIPIQSGDDGILKRMNRNYDCSFLFRLIREIHERIPGASIGADVIAGFPGESEERFESTYALVDSLPFSYLHVFPYSKRRGTPASAFSGTVGDRVIKMRAERLRKLGKEKRLAFYRRFLHEKMEVLMEGRAGKSKDRLKGLSKNYVPVLLSLENGSIDPAGWINQERTVLVTGISESGVTGKSVEE